MISTDELHKGKDSLCTDVQRIPKTVAAPPITQKGEGPVGCRSPLDIKE